MQSICRCIRTKPKVYTLKLHVKTEPKVYTLKLASLCGSHDSPWPGSVRVLLLQHNGLPVVEPGILQCLLALGEQLVCVSHVAVPHTARSIFRDVELDTKILLKVI